MKKSISFGKYAICSNRKINKVTVGIELVEKDGKSVLSICGNVWNIRGTDIVIGGQCMNRLAKYVSTPLFKELYRLWKNYHLNDMHAGTIEQEQAIEEWKADGNKYDYKAACEHLQSIGLYEVEVDGKPYKYGHGWLYRAIPEDDLNLIKKIIQTGEL